MDRDRQSAAVREQFGRQAAAYRGSAIHREGRSLAEALDWLAPGPKDVVLDVATGAGHMALALAPLVARVTGLDLTQGMLEQAAAEAATRGLVNVRWQEGRAEAMPFPDRSFTIVTCRLAAHHFPDLPGFLREAARVLVPGGRFCLIDTCGPEDPFLDAAINEIEWQRDSTHLRSLRPSEWQALLEESSFRVVHLRAGLGEMSMRLTEWMERSATTPERARWLRQRLDRAEPSLRQALALQKEGDDWEFELPFVRILARRSVAYPVPGEV